jgi:hypothetical protein
VWPETFINVNFDTFSEESMRAIITSWYSECCASHDSCRVEIDISSQRSLPSRLLDLGEEQLLQPASVCLVTTSQLPIATEYATFSHCWGKQVPLTLTMDNLDAFQQGISIDVIPRKFWQAMCIVKVLGLRYFWVDSMCICQDNPTDWAGEAARMDAVYEHSSVNIAATFAKDAVTDLFIPQSNHSLIPYKILLAANGQAYYCYDENLWHGKISSSPLAGRAWAVQELILARRTLHFAENQMFWECSELNASEIYPRGLPRPYRFKEEKLKLVKPRPAEIIPAQSGWTVWALGDEIDPVYAAPDMSTHSQETELSSRRRRGAATPYLDHASVVPDSELPDRRRRNAATPYVQHEPSILDLWPVIVQRFSQGNLTYPDRDKLTALSGIAKRVADKDKSLSHEYLAGLWRSHLPYCLGWRALIMSLRPCVYQAPTFSWASLNSPVKLPNPDAIVTHKGIIATVLDVQIYRSTPDPTGQVSGGSIMLQGLMARVTVRNINVGVGTLYSDVKGDISVCTMDTSYARLYPDTAAPVSGQIIYCFLIEASTKVLSGVNTIHGLLMERAPGRGSYTRIGSFEIISQVEYVDLSLLGARQTNGDSIVVDDEDNEYNNSYSRFIDSCRDFGGVATQDEVIGVGEPPNPQCTIVLY